MARRHGRNGQVYVSVTSGAAASPCAFQATWTISMTTDKQEVTALGDGNKVYVAGLPDSSGDFSGFWDDQTSQTYIAATDGAPRNFYLYPDTTNDINTYWFGTILPDFAATGGVAASVTAAATWVAASRVQRYTAFGGLNT